MAVTLSLDSFSSRLPDGDIVQVVIADGGAPPDECHFALRTHGGEWKKRVVLHRDGDHTLEAEKEMTTSQLVVRRGEIDGISLTFWKAKEFGNMRPIYELAGSELVPLLGKHVIWDWMRD